MITRLEVDGFKSLQGFAVDLEPFTVFIGPNGAGKSNILEALALLSRLASMPIVDAFKQGRGRPGDQFSRHGDIIASEIRFAVEFLFFGTRNDFGRFRYELVIERLTRSSGTEHLTVQHEQLQTLQREEDTWIDARPEFAQVVTPSHKVRFFAAAGDQMTWSPEQLALPLELGLLGSPGPIPLDPQRTVLAQKAAFPMRGIQKSLRLCQWLRLDLAHLAGPSDRVDTGQLRTDGSNLATVLADLAPELLGEIRADLVALVPGVSSFLVVPEGDTFRIDFELSGGERLPARLVSDGTLRLLALLTALRVEPRPSLIGIEEPENGIYPGRLLALVDVLRQEATRRQDEEPGWAAALPGSTDLLPTQILLTTHSPLILTALRQHPRYLRFVDVVHRDHRRVTRARTVGHSNGDPRHLAVSPREIDELLNTVTGGDFA
jgi:predicted ATPase